MNNIITNTKYKILTPTGYCNFSGIRKIKSSTYIKIKTNKSTLNVTPKHIFVVNTQYIFAYKLKVGDKLENNSKEFEIITSIKTINLQKKYKISIYERPLTHINMFLSKTSSILRKYKIREQVWIYFQGPFGIFQHESYHGCYIQNSCRGMTRYKHCQKFLKKAAKCGKICMIEKYCNYV